MNAIRIDETRPGIGPETQVFGVGNCGRSDDGLGWAFLDRIQQLPGFESPVEYRYQLQVEDAALVARATRVIFIDSYDGDLPGGFRWAPCEAAEDFQFTTHVLPPRGVMHYCQTLFGHTPPADLLMISGSEWDLRNALSDRAERNLEAALAFFSQHILGRAAA